MKALLILGVLVFVGMQKLAQFLIYLFCILLFGYGSGVLVRDLRAWNQERRARRHLRKTRAA